ncbi:hypothetical protein [Polyangium sorediatum]|uniref:Four helix bundle protein n=1 Tax=Polyangium sorediatum TaxID=889274 RepID=A0ABT6NMZ1_9BACT|nr:hypothetical protein [Polyangium sorediatum]MDI1429696.1 hypothetical protein [Polyangium sorediatum]
MGSDVNGLPNRQRYSTALGSAHEVLACIHVAQAMHDIESVSPAVLDRIDLVIATLTGLVYRRAPYTKGRASPPTGSPPF